ncbi:MAG: hypothetical protein L3K07_00300 [Thermoplasmata archaeon]|nr:hypothetical protein [Thermoplasmata archaeon]
MARPASKSRNPLADFPVASLVLLVGILAVLPVGGLLVWAGHSPSIGSAAPRVSLGAAPASASAHLASPHAPLLSPAPSWWNITGLSLGGPAARILGTMAWDATDGYSVLFGGSSGGGVPPILGDTWSFRNGTWTQLSPSLHPLPRVFQAMAYDPLDGYVLLFGGYNGSAVYGDTWAFSHGQWTNISPLSSPSVRYGSSLTYDAADGEMLLYGGLNVSGAPLSETWAFAHGSWNQLSPATNPGPLIIPTMVYDAADGYVLMEGGSHNNSDLGVTGACWRFSGGVWTQLTPALLPAPRLAADAAYDPATSTPPSPISGSSTPGRGTRSRRRPRRGRGSARPSPTSRSLAICS